MLKYNSAQHASRLEHFLGMKNDFVNTTEPQAIEKQRGDSETEKARIASGVQEHQLNIVWKAYQRNMKSFVKSSVWAEKQLWAEEQRKESKTAANQAQGPPESSDRKEAEAATERVEGPPARSDSYNIASS